MITQDIPWKIGEGFIRVVIDDTNDWKVKVLSITSTPNEGYGRSQEITITTTQGTSEKKILVCQPGLLSIDGAWASTPDKDYDRIIDCSTSNSEFGVLESDKIYDCGDSSNI